MDRLCNAIFLVLGNTALFSIHEAIKPLYYVSKFLLIWPFNYNKTKLIPLSIYEKLCNVIIALLWILYVGWSTYGKLVFVWDKKFPSPTIFDIIFTLPLHCLIIYSFIISSFRQTKLTIKFYHDLERVDRSTIAFNGLGYLTIKKALKNKILIMYLSATVISICDLYPMTLVLGLSRIIYFLCLYIGYYPALAIMLQIVNKADLLKQHFKAVNSNLRQIAMDLNNGHMLESRRKLFQSSSQPYLIRNISKVHIKLCDLIDTINEIHGFQTALLYCCIVALMLLALNYGLWSDDIKPRQKIPALKIIMPAIKFILVLIYLVGIDNF